MEWQLYVQSQCEKTGETMLRLSWLFVDLLSTPNRMQLLSWIHTEKTMSKKFHRKVGEKKEKEFILQVSSRTCHQLKIGRRFYKTLKTKLTLFPS